MLVEMEPGAVSARGTKRRGEGSDPLQFFFVAPVGMIEAFATRRPVRPWAQSRASTTAIGT
jgi:hypothetical protein